MAHGIKVATVRRQASRCPWYENSRLAAPCGALALWVINAWLCWPLFRIEYLDQFQSVEGSFIASARFLQTYWPHVRWFPWFNCGMPLEAMYLPLVPAMTALAAHLTGDSAAHMFHFVAALAYSFAPAALFLLARRVSGAFRPSFMAALLWSVFSPSALIPAVRADMGGALAMRRLHTIVFYGEVPHNVAICLAPLALLAVDRYLTRRSAARFAAAALAIAVVMISNAFGVVLIAVSTAILAAVRDRESWKRLPEIGALLLMAYALICRFVPPWLLGLIEKNSQTAGGDYRFTTQTRLLGLLFLIALIALCKLPRFSNPMLHFSVAFLFFFGGLTLVATQNVFIVPQAQRYQLEMEMGVCLVAAFVLPYRKLDLLPRSARILLAALGAAGLVWIGAADRQYARQLIRAADPAAKPLVQEARWIGVHLPGERVMASGESEFWLDDFTHNPQLSSGHEPTAPNWVQRVAVYTIYSGENAGDRDGPVSLLWLKAFGCSAVTVPGERSGDPYHPVRNPRKFDGLLPLIWREADRSVYRVPERNRSLAHVIPASKIVNRRPSDGLDTAELSAYVAALDNEPAPGASLVWRNPEQAEIVAEPGADQVISVQVSYDPGWRASANGHRLAVSADKLGLLVISPGQSGPMRIDLQFTEGRERAICSLVSALAIVSALLVLGASIMQRSPRRQ